MSSQPSIIALILTPVGSILAALITGFLAARMKHKWDMDAERVKWEREAGKRAREEILQAFGAYLTARPNVATVNRFSDDGQHGVQVDYDGMLNALRLEATRLLILLNDEADRQVVENDLSDVRVWLASLSASMMGDAIPETPTEQDVLNLARRLSQSAPS